jgi:demethylmenaquinone methyltransferase/2-methoxy-6-polyprenyl-1,4-benzoquinol methylase
MATTATVAITIPFFTPTPNHIPGMPDQFFTGICRDSYATNEKIKLNNANMYSIFAEARTRKMYNLSRKGEQIQQMFGAIAPRYDFLNRLLSLGIDRGWRKFMVQQTKWNKGGRLLDVATGTGDVALQIAKISPPEVSVVGIDFCKEMVDIGREKVAASPYAGRITFEIAPCEEIPFPDATFDSVTIAFGIRNVVDRPLGLREMLRVLKPGGVIAILEPATPRFRVIAILYNFYFMWLLPRIGGLFSRFEAYKYLRNSVLEFPSRQEFLLMMEHAGFVNVICHDLTLGIATVFTGQRGTSEP